MSAWRGEMGRKAVHLSTAVLPACIYWAPPPWSWRGPVLAFLLVLGADLVRLGHAGTHRWLQARVGRFLRASERRGLISVHYLTGAAALLALAAPAAVAATALAYLIVGDAAAALVGGRFGRVRLGRKSLEGSLACFACCAGVGAWLLPAEPQAILGGALIATVVEVLPLPVDDNWSVPLLSAAALWLLL